MKTLTSRFLLALPVAACLWGNQRLALAQRATPVLKVMTAGANAEQARTLANMLQIPYEELSVNSGELVFLNSASYVAVPAAPVTDPKIIRELSEQTENPFPNIPLRFEQIDFDALRKLTVPADDEVLRAAANALGQSRLDPQYGSPAISHSMLTALYVTENNLVISNRQALDTKLTYEFKTPEGYRLVGPGAQVQLTFAPDGQVSHLLYSARSFEPGEIVDLIPADEVIRRATELFPGETKISAELVYYCPPLWQPSPGRWEVRNLVPFYSLTARGAPTPGRPEEVEMLAHLVPATEHPAYVPAVQLNASVNGRSILASAEVGGGQPPYTFEWSGSDPNLMYSNSPSVLYTPKMEVGLPKLTAGLSREGKLVLSWPHDPASAPALRLEAATSMARPDWQHITPPIATNTYSVVTLSISNTTAVFYRIVLAQEPVLKSETLSVKVLDANGIQVQAVQTLQVGVLPALRQPKSGIGVQTIGVVDWGTESPFDTELGWHDRQGWTAGMILGGAGVQRFRWLDKSAWKIDFQDAPVGDNDDMLDNADMVMYIGHGNPQGITFTGGPGLHPHDLLYNDATKSWGNRDEEWLCFLSCSVLKFDDAAGNVWQRWGPNFDGLHILTGFSTSAGAMTGFPFAFTQKMLGGFFFGSPKPIVQAWFAAAHARGTGSPVAMGPIGPGGVWNYGDYYWGKGPVGPTIRATQIRGWWYAH